MDYNNNTPIQPKKFDFMEYVKPILLKARMVVTDPKGCWDTIKEEEGSVEKLFKDFAIPFFALYPICHVVGALLRGGHFFYALKFQIVNYLMLLFGTWLFGMVMVKVVEKYEGKATVENATKVAVYCAVPHILGNVLFVIPFAISVTSVLSLIIGIYGLYLYIVGLPKLVDFPQDKKLQVYLLPPIIVGVIVLVVSFLLACIGLASSF